ncbi:MAG: FAD:protein FMN transferase [Pirellulales bacterium]
MSRTRTSTRRAFLKGKAAADALADLTAGSPGTTGVSPAPAPVGGGYLTRLARRAMACEFQLLFDPGPRQAHLPAAVAALDLIEQLEDKLTVFREHSEVMEINRQAAHEPVPVEARLFELLTLAVELSRQTQGAFDTTSGPLTKVWGFYRRAGSIPEADDLAAALQRVGSKHLRLDAAEQTIRFNRDGMEINLGAIGKGYALDRAAEALTAAGVESFLIHGGRSSVVARGSPSDEAAGWPVGLVHPLRPATRLAEIRLVDRALGTSGSGTQYFRHRGRRYGHLLDPRTGQPAHGTLSATAIAPTAAEADALSTAMYVLGVEGAKELCRQRSGLAAILVTPGSHGGSVEVHSVGLGEAEFRLSQSTL